MSKEAPKGRDTAIVVALITAVASIAVALIGRDWSSTPPPTPTPVVVPTAERTPAETEPPQTEEPTAAATSPVTETETGSDPTVAATPTPGARTDTDCPFTVSSTGDTWTIGGEARPQAAHVEMRLRTEREPFIYLTPNGWSKNAESLVIAIDEARSWSQVATLADGDYVAVVRYRNRDNTGADTRLECDFTVTDSPVLAPAPPDDVRNTDLIKDPPNGAYLYGDHPIAIALNDGVDEFTIEPEINPFVPEMYRALLDGARVTLKDLLGAVPPAGAYVIEARSGTSVDVQTLTIAEVPPS